MLKYLSWKISSFGNYLENRLTSSFKKAIVTKCRLFLFSPVNISLESRLSLNIFYSGDGSKTEWTFSQNALVRQVEETRALVQFPRLGTYYLNFINDSDCARFVHFLEACSSSNASRQNVFDNRTDISSSVQYFQFYSLLSQQQNMLQDYIRTSTYQRAIVSNASDFQNAVVLDVGAGSGILSFFAAQAGAKKVYAVEASSMAKLAERLFAANGLQDKIQVLEGKLEELKLPEPVDIIVSEPLGYMLLNERMLETFLHAKKWLKPQGRMFPSESLLFCAPFTDEYLYMELGNKAAFWYQQSFYGVDLSHLKDEALKEYFRQPVVDTFDIRILVAQPERRVFDFQTLTEQDLTIVDMPLDFIATTSANVHGLAFWFDVAFIGTDKTIWLSTAPTEPLTHWYQVRCLFPNPIYASAGDRLVGRLLMTANTRQSYDVHMELEVIPVAKNGAFGNQKASNILDLKSPYFRYTQVAQIPPGNHQVSFITCF